MTPLRLIATALIALVALLTTCHSDPLTPEQGAPEGPNPSHGQQSSRNYRGDSVGVDSVFIHVDSLSQ